MLENNIKTAVARRYYEGKWICKLKTLASHGLDTVIGDYAKKMYNFFLFSDKRCFQFRYYIHMIMKTIVKFRTELVEFACFHECNCLMYLFFFTSCYNIMSSLMSILCFDSRTASLKRRQKQSVFSAED